MGKILPNTQEIQSATASHKLNGTLDLIEGDFMKWKKIEKSLLVDSINQYQNVIDVSSAASMNIFKFSSINTANIDTQKILEEMETYPFIVPKDKALEEIVSTFLNQKLEVVTETKEVTVFNGTYAALRTIALALPGQYVLVPEFINQAQKESFSALSKTVVEVPMHVPGWTFDITQLKQKLVELQGNISFLYIHHVLSPNLTDEYFTEIADVCAEFDVITVLDLDILKTQHTPTHTPLLPLRNKKLREQGIFLFTLSKEFGAPGIRIGFGIANQEITNRIKNFQQRSLEMTPPVTRYLAQIILQNTKLDEISLELQSRMTHLVTGLQSIELEAKFPNIGVNLFMHVPRAFEHTTSVLPDHLFTYYCLTRAGVVLRPGSLYGHRINHFVRFVVCQNKSEIDEMVARLRDVGISGTMKLPEGLENEYQKNIQNLDLS